MASNIKQHVNGAIASDSLQFPALYHTIRHSVGNEQQQSLRNQFPSCSTAEKPSSIKLDVPRPLFQNWHPSHSFAKDDQTVKSSHDRQKKKFHNNNNQLIENNMKNKKKQQIILIEDDQQRVEKQYDKQMRGGNIVMNQNIKNKQIPLQSTQTNPRINSPYQKTDHNIHKSSKINSNTNYVQHKPSHDHQSKMVDDNQKNQFNNFKQQANRQNLQSRTNPHEHSSRKQQQHFQRPTFYPSNNSLSYNGLFPQNSSYYNNMNYMNNMNTSNISFPTMMNYVPGSIFNDPTNQIMWGHNLNSYNNANAQNNFGYLHGVLDNNNVVNKPMMDMSHVNLNSYGNDFGMYNGNYDKNTVGNEKIDVAYNQKNRIYKDKNLIYSKEPQLIIQEPLGNPLPKQSTQRQKNSRNQHFSQNKYLNLKPKQHQKRDTASSVSDKKNTQNVIILDSDDQEGQVDANNKLKQPSAITPTLEGRIMQSNIPSHVDMRSMIPQMGLPSHMDMRNMGYQSNISPHADMRNIPVASQYNPAAYQQYSHYPYSGLPSSNNLMRPQQYSQYQTNSQNIPASGRSYKQHCELRQQHLDKTKKIQKMKSHLYQNKRVVSEDRQKLAEERIQNIGKIREMCMEQQKDLSTLLKHSTKIPSLFSTIKATIPDKAQLQSSTNPLLDQKIMSFDTYISMVRLSKGGSGISEMKQLQQGYNAYLLAHAHAQQQQLNNKVGTNAVQGQIAGSNAQLLPKNHSSAYPYTLSKEISGTEHVKRQAQKAFEKTRSRIHNQQQSNIKHSLMETYRKTTSRKQKRNNDINYDKLINSISSQLSTKLQSSSLQQSSEEKQKVSGYVFQWTPRLKRLRDLSKKRQVDNVILIGPDFQADIPTFVTDQAQLRIIKTVKRNGLLKRFYKYTSKI